MTLQAVPCLIVGDGGRVSKVYSVFVAAVHSYLVVLFVFNIQYSLLDSSVAVCVGFMRLASRDRRQSHLRVQIAAAFITRNVIFTELQNLITEP